jgi:phosphoribosylformylglycinamidine cyclo-ligase
MPTYKSAGVDDKKAEALIEIISKKTSRTSRSAKSSAIGYFGGFFPLATAKYRQPVLVASCDGVGTKLLVAHEMHSYENIGVDLVAMNCNDVAVCGASPLFFLDYLAVGKLNLIREEKLIAGIIKGCEAAECLLIGGETAQMPEIYKKEDFDLAGFCVGIVEKRKILGPQRVKKGDILIGVASNGLHSNGFSLVRKIFLSTSRKRSLLYAYNPTLGRSLGEELLRPTFIYTRLLKKLAQNNYLSASAHITGGGIPGNLSRALPENLQAIIKKSSWQVPRIFPLMQEIGKITPQEMFKVFNMGLGLILIAKPAHESAILKEAKHQGYRAQVIGIVEPGPKKVSFKR